MSGEDDAFDIDIYGDEEQPQEQAADEIDYTYDEESKDHSNADQAAQGSNEQPQTNGNATTTTAPESAPIGPSLKRKAPDDEIEQPQTHTPSTHATPSHQQPTDPNAQPALKLTDLNWWTTEDDLRSYCSAARSETSLTDLSFGEHRINGKSRGEAYLEFRSAAAAAATKSEIERRNEAGTPKPGGGYVREKFKVWYMPVGNPFRGKDGGVGDRKFGGAAGKFDNQGGAYNNSYANRGGYNRGGGGGRGGGFVNRGGFTNNARGGAMGGGQQQWGNNGGMMNGNPAATGFPNPMMSNFANMNGYNQMGMNNMAAGFNMMNRGGMMGNMMGGGRGGFPNQMMSMNGMNGGGMGVMGMNMGGMNGGMGMNMRGGGGSGGMMARGGWGGGSQSPPQQQQGGMNKKPRME